MGAIAAHLRYIGKNGRLEVEDDRGEILRGKQAVRDLAEDWRYSGSLIPEHAGTVARREAINIMLSMPRGTDPLAVQRAAREFAHLELAGHKYAMVLHDHQANPHVHISVRAESRTGKRLSPRKADLHRWREIFAEKLRELGVDAEASRQASRGRSWNPSALWRLKARLDGRLRPSPAQTRPRARASSAITEAAIAWGHLAEALDGSGQPEDRRLGAAVAAYVRGTPALRDRAATRNQTDEMADRSAKR